MASELPGETGGERRQLSTDTAFQLLANGRRRATLTYLREHDEGTLRGLSTHIAAAENDVTETELTAAQRKRVSIGLYQCHLPKLQRAGVVDYDRARGTVRRTELANDLDRLLDLAAEFGQTDGE